MKDIPNIGYVPNTEHRDAIHIAVIPAVAGERLHPGEFVTKDPIGEDDPFFYVTENPENIIGIVDPFIKRRYILKGQKFWLFLVPGTITGLRHEWTHPAFDTSKENKQILKVYDPKANAEAWLREYCDKYSDSAPSYETLIKAVEEGYDKYSDFLTINGSDAHGEIPDEVWNKLEIVLERKFNKDERPADFSCSC
jgi:hypothetical protein